MGGENRRGEKALFSERYYSLQNIDLFARLSSTFINRLHPLQAIIFMLFSNTDPSLKYDPTLISTANHHSFSYTSILMSSFLSSLEFYIDT